MGCYYIFALKINKSLINLLKHLRESLSAFPQAHHLGRNNSSFKAYCRKINQTYEFYLWGYKATPSWQGQPRTKILRGSLGNIRTILFCTKPVKPAQSRKDSTHFTINTY
jgi:hypothetical protein